MRLYSWVMGLYLNDKQHGIQSSHAMGELMLKHKNDSTNKDKLFWDWANKHKTICLLDAKNYRGLLNLVEMFDTVENPYPWATFNEDNESLGGLMTCVSIILPERIYGRAKEMRELIKSNHTTLALTSDGWCDVKGEKMVRIVLIDEGYSAWEIELMLILPTYQLA